MRVAKLREIAVNLGVQTDELIRRLDKDVSEGHIDQHAETRIGGCIEGYARLHAALVAALEDV